MKTPKIIDGEKIIIEKEGEDDNVVFIASSSEINVLAEGKTIDEAKRKFVEGLRAHLENFPDN